MAKQKYKDADTLRQKIDQLFTYRKLFDLIRLGDLDKNKSWVNHLLQIQTQIYHLDAYLESTWELKKEELDKFWTAIRTSLLDMGYPKGKLKKLLREIKQYERIEKDMRKDKWPTRIAFKDFYTTKSCDVRLMRHLIYEASPGLEGIWKENTWTYYDLITEINDDVTDVHEDLLTYNGNRFLISLLRKGVPPTVENYKRYIGKVTAKANLFFKHHPKQALDHQLHDWVLARADETLALLEDSRKIADADHLATASILQHMK